MREVDVFLAEIREKTDLGLYSPEYQRIRRQVIIRRAAESWGEVLDDIAYYQKLLETQPCGD